MSIILKIKPETAILKIVNFIGNYFNNRVITQQQYENLLRFERDYSCDLIEVSELFKPSDPEILCYFTFINPDGAESELVHTDCLTKKLEFEESTKRILLPSTNPESNNEITTLFIQPSNQILEMMNFMGLEHFASEMSHQQFWGLYDFTCYYHDIDIIIKTPLSKSKNPQILAYYIYDIKNDLNSHFSYLMSFSSNLVCKPYIIGFSEDNADIKLIIS